MPEMAVILMIRTNRVAELRGILPMGGTSREMDLHPIDRLSGNDFRNMFNYNQLQIFTQTRIIQISTFADRQN